MCLENMRWTEVKLLSLNLLDIMYEVHIIIQISFTLGTFAMSMSIGYSKNRILDKFRF